MNKMQFIPSEDVYKNKDMIIDEALNFLYQVTLIDENCNIVHMNQNYCDYLGYPREELIGKNISDIIPGSRLHETITSGESTFNDIFVYDDGRKLVYSKMPVKNSDGKPIGVVSISAFDTTDINHELYSELEDLRFSNEMYEKRLNALNSAPSVFDNIVGRSPSISDIKTVLNKVINSRLPILLTGESGTGKEVFANAIHNASDWKDAPFIRVNCAAIPKELMESELFGYEPGSFSGALNKGKPGKFELANNGTIMLDEISELPLDMQTKLLRVLQEYEVERIGSVKPKKLNIQVICCTNSDLYEKVKEHKFREDLLYRINVMEIEIPPLRERIEDIEDLSKSLIKKINNKYNINIKGITKDAISYLKRYDWPGNVRELEHVIERACIIVRDRALIKNDFLFLEKKILGTDLQEKTNGRNKKNASDTLMSNESFKEIIQNSEKDEIIKALKLANGNKKVAAEKLNISRSNLYYKIKKLGIKF